MAQNYLRNGGKGKLLAFAIVSFLATSAFYVQTLFIVYAIFLTLFVIEMIVTKGKEGLVRSIRLSLVTFFVNAFWLLPVIYFALASPLTPGNSHINSIATPETQIMNQARSGVIDIASLKGYWFDYYDWSSNGTYDYLYKEWISHSANYLVTGLSLTLFFMSVVGLILGITKKKEIKFSYLILLPICYYLLAGGQVPIPFFSEAFRNAFTKWSIALALILSVGIGSLVHFLGDLHWRKLAIFLSVFASICVISASVYTVYPVFDGKLIADSMRVNLPGYYLDTINYFKTQDPSKRIADFPLTDFWGWKFNDWGYRGSGFMWYGIPQPMLDRAFDVWSSYDEEFYTEVSHAVEAGNRDELKYVLYKYQVSYILFDGSIFEPGNPDSSSTLQKEKDLLESSGFITRAEEFGKITIYQVNLDGANSFVSAPQVDFSSPYVVLGQANLTPAVTETFPDSQGYQNVKNCDLKNQGSVVKKKLDGGNYYAAYDGGTSCDYFYFPTLDYSQAYLMRVKGKNISGRSLKFYLYNVGSKSVDRVELLPVGKFDKSFTILPTISSPSAGLGYTLNVETRSFGKIKSENLITAIEFYPVASQALAEPAPIANNLSILNVRKYGTGAYKVDVRGSGLIQLGQGYEGGWVAFEAKDFPFTIFHLPFLEHIKVNSWSNGWLVPEGVSRVYIFYWPQLLEWGGMALGLVLTLVIIRLY